MHDPLVPLDFGGWFRRVSATFRRSFVALSTLALIPAALGVAHLIILDAIRPSEAETQRRLVEAAHASPTGTLAPQTEFMIKHGPLLPAVLPYLVLISLCSAFVYGGAYYVALRHANGQPVATIAAMRWAGPRVLPLIGWGLLAWFGTVVIFLGLLLPGQLTGNPWLNMIGPAIGFVVLLGVSVTVSAVFFGVVFVD
jgi:hypothetical protein